MKRPHWRKMTWVVLAFNALMLLWIIVGVASATHNPHCAQTGLIGAKACQDAADTGAGIGAAIIVVLWALGDIILGVIWMVTRGRECSACGRRVRRGVTTCGSCGFDFRQAASTPQATGLS